MRIETLEQFWQEIEASPKPDQLGWVRRLANAGAVVPVHAAVACRGGTRSIMLDIPVTAVILLQHLPSTSGLTVELVPALQNVPEGMRTLAVALEDYQYVDIFSVFCADVVDGISRCVKVQDAVLLLLQRFQRWQQFLSKAVDGLSQQALIGLYGELQVLREILIPLCGIGMVAAWCGAQRTPQDFIVPGICAVEVKSTMARSMLRVRIHGERQLDDNGLTSLFLVCFRLQREEGSGESLNQLVDELRQRAAIAPEFSMILDQHLADAGWFERHRQRYEAQRLVVAQRRFFRVGEGFPRLLPRSLAAGIDEVEYQLDLRSCESMECGFKEFEASLRALELASGK
ncbi:PD-(D/E)XK motif protein [Hydrogenophaga sp.]|uniref:PD-(D/E)XK motif protein n=1 Tax=Hydrogenophaga sp. TaxID=1904254 RepID=UPI003F6F8EE1